MKGSEMMGRTKPKQDETSTNVRPALTHEAQESYLISLAEQEAEYQIRNHTASSQVITHFLKLGCEKTRLEQEKLRAENELLKAKTEQVKAAKTSEEMYSKVLAAIKDYSGYGESYDEDESTY